MTIKKKSEKHVIVKKSGRGKDGQSLEVETTKGVPLDQTDRHFGDVPCMGLSKGITANMGDFQSLRIDVWVSVPLNDTSRNGILKKRDEIVSILDEIIDDELEKETI